MPAPIVNVVADAPTFGHAEIVVRPRPAANDTRTSAVAIAIKAPEKIAAQLTAEYDNSFPVIIGRTLAVSVVLMSVP